MLQVFKILNGYEDSPRFFTLSSTGLRGHSLKLFNEKNRLLLRKQTFTQRAVDSWNNIPDNAVKAPSINVFKSRFNTHTRGASSNFCSTYGIWQPSTSNDHKCVLKLKNSSTITCGSL